MAQGARVQSFDALRSFRAALFKYAEQINVALTDAEGELQRVMGWLERDQASFWQFQLRKRHEQVVRCQEALRMKKLFKGPDGKPPSTVDEEKALAVAQKRLAVAEAKAKNTTAWTRRLPKEILMYKGQVTRLSVAVNNEIPTAAAQLSRLIATLEAYIASSARSDAAADQQGKLVTEALAGGSMSRSQGEQTLSPWIPLRKLTPGGPAREKVAGQDASGVGVNTAQLTPVEMERLVALPGPRAAYDPSSRVVVHKNLGAAGRVYLERAEIGFGGDSGWYIGDAESAAVDPGGSMALSTLLEKRPDLIDILTLPKGYLVVMDRGGVLAVLDPADNELWKLETPVVEPPSTAAVTTEEPAQTAGEAAPT